ncbi:nucleolus and neural progenitor protein [Parambassis ranga]|uniref:Nucleolus and neural progenitor protein n=1 Tax=Parambassis ranga TaxID=210632 RepID=A0A6P7H3S9_9TELE|nr:nucleolus and neural progenitor protein [Parambassis ranga]
MAAEPWNKINIPFPGAVSSVRISFTSATAMHIKSLSAENEKVLALFRSEILQTEIRVLYELLHILHNSSKGNKTFKGLQQVEQCVNRLKNMKLDAALCELTDLCPTRIQRELSIKAGVCDVPSQPMIEWICLKVLGAARLMSCTLKRCTRAFVLTRQQMKWEEFIILNVVITSLLSRLWVIFRGMLVSLSALYKPLLEVLRDVAQVQPMPFLTDFTLPLDIAEFLGPTDAALMSKHAACDPHGKVTKKNQQMKKKSSVRSKKQGQTSKIKEDLGVAVSRGFELETDIKSFLKINKNIPKDKSFTHKADKKQMFKKQVREATSFMHMVTHLEEMIQWCKSQRMEKERRLLTFLRLKCQKMKCLEASGYNVQRKLQTFRHEARRASSPQGSMPKTIRSHTVMKRNSRLKRRFQSLRSRFPSSSVRTGVKRKHQRGRRNGTDFSGFGFPKDNQCSRMTEEETNQTTDSDIHDDIDDIFASVGL